jgi:GTP-binding protein EngB required for normal cell division
MDHLKSFFHSNGHTSNSLLNKEFKLCFIGKTKAGKSSIINALRGLYKTDLGYASTSNELSECTLEFDEYDFNRDGKHYNIKLVDSKGINNDDVDQETIGKLIEKYDGIVFVTNDALLKEDLNLFKNIDQKPFVIFFVRTRFDSILDGELNNTRNLDDERAVAIRQEKIGSLRHDMKSVLIKSNISKIITDKSLYLITATTRQFETSPDGKRFLSDLILLDTLKKNENIDLNNASSYQLIRYKRNFLRENLWESLLLISTTSFSSIVPFLDTLFSKMLIDDKKAHWFEIFGIQKLLDLKNSGELASALGKSDEIVQRLEVILNEIEKEKDYFDLDKFKDIFKSGETSNKNEWYEKLKKFYTDGNVTNDLLKLLTFGGAGLAKLLEVTLKTIGRALLVTIPIFCAIYIYITYNSLVKMIDLCESHAIEIYRILHE